MSKYSREQIAEIISKSRKKRDISNSPSLASHNSAHHPKQAKHSKPQNDMAIRYQELCDKYRLLLEEVKDKHHEYLLKDKELERLKSDREKDQREIKRLRALIGIVKKEDFGVQVNMEMQSASGSWTTKLEKSTEIQITTDGFSPKRARSPQILEALMARVSQTAKDKKFASTSYANMQKGAQERSKNSVEMEGKEKKQVGFYKAKEVGKSPCHKLSNSPYSKFRYVRNGSGYAAKE